LRRHKFTYLLTYLLTEVTSLDADGLKNKTRKATRPKEVENGLQIYLQPRMTLLFDLLRPSWCDTKHVWVKIHPTVLETSRQKMICV